MSDLNIQLCPETGICSIIKGDGSKVDLMPDEVRQLKEAGGDVAAIKKALAEVDAGFADQLDSDEVDQVSKQLK
jgi:hypothetical protein